MFELQKVKGILFDYGGTIDSNGMHWAEVIWQAYEAFKVPISKEVFRDVYVFTERILGKNPVIQSGHTFSDMMCLKCFIQIERLIESDQLKQQDIAHNLSDALAEWCYIYAKKSVEKARPILEEVSKRYPLVLVSNFYGNIESVLKDFKLDHIFPIIIESAVVGVRKPDPEIFRMGTKALNLDSVNCVVIGDSYDKDIIPAKEIECQTIWLKSIGWDAYNGDETADVIISDFSELKKYFNL